jgi:hypothetical protein
MGRFDAAMAERQRPVARDEAQAIGAAASPYCAGARPPCLEAPAIPLADEMFMLQPDVQLVPIRKVDKAVSKRIGVQGNSSRRPASVKGLGSSSLGPFSTCPYLRSAWKMNSRKSTCRISNKLESRRRHSSSGPQPHCVPWPNILEMCIKMRFFGCSTAGDERRLGADARHQGRWASTKIGFTLSHARRAARFLCEAVPKVPEGS